VETTTTAPGCVSQATRSALLIQRWKSQQFSFFFFLRKFRSAGEKRRKEIAGADGCLVSRGVTLHTACRAGLNDCRKPRKSGSAHFFQWMGNLNFFSPMTRRKARSPLNVDIHDAKFHAGRPTSCRGSSFWPTNLLARSISAMAISERILDQTLVPVNLYYQNIQCSPRHQGLVCLPLTEH